MNPFMLCLAALAVATLHDGPFVADGRFRSRADIPRAQEAYLVPPENSSHAANLLRLRDGDLLCAWFAGTWEGDSGVGIYVARLAPGSDAWQPAQLVARRAGVSFQNPVMFETPSGEFWMIHTTQPAKAGEDDAEVLVEKSSDHGEHWSEPATLIPGKGLFVRQPVVVQPDGSWLLPAYQTRTNQPVMEVTRDQGAHWTETAVPGPRGCVQPQVIRLGDHDYLAMFRRRQADFIYESRSTDGVHWPVPQPTAVPNNNASVQATRLADGTLVLAYDNSPRRQTPRGPRPGPRKPLSLATSTDGGRTWHWRLDLETGRPGANESMKQPGRDEYSYPSITVGSDGDIYVAYTYRRAAIKVVRLPTASMEGAARQ